MHSCARLGSYMGLWQLAQAASVLKTPVHSIYPVRGESTIRNDFSRMFFPIEYSVTANDEPRVIMWTSLSRGAAPIHFVPLLNNEEYTLFTCYHLIIYFQVDNYNFVAVNGYAVGFFATYLFKQFSRPLLLFLNRTKLY